MKLDSRRWRSGAAAAAALLMYAVPARAQEPSPAPSPSPAPEAATPAPVTPAPATPPPAVRVSWRRRISANDKRRSLRSYPANLAYNALGVVTSGNYKPLGVAVALGAMSYPYDKDVVGFFTRHPHDQFGKTGQALGGGIFVGAAAVGAFSIGRMAPWEHFRASTYDLSQAVVVNLAYTFALKEIVRRDRPNHSDNLSFPSGHASNAFAAAVVVERHFGWKVGAPAYALATYIATSRLAAEKHHLSDITFGAAFGYGVGRAVVRRDSRAPTPPGGVTPPTVAPKDEKKSELLLMPDTGPSGDGRGLRLSFSF